MALYSLPCWLPISVASVPEDIDTLVTCDDCTPGAADRMWTVGWVRARVLLRNVLEVKLQLRILVP